MVVCIVIALAGIISIFSLPVEQYPEVAPPQIRVNTTYRGADAETIANTLAAPLEEEVNGVEGMIYMDSTSSNNGEYELYVTFATGTDPDMALVASRVQTASLRFSRSCRRRSSTKASRSRLRSPTLWASSR